MGLMLGVELVRDRASQGTGQGPDRRGGRVGQERGLLLGKGGLHGNVLRIKPPMCLSIDDADFIVDCLDEVLPLAGLVDHDYPLHRFRQMRSPGSRCLKQANGSPAPAIVLARSSIRRRAS